MNRALLVLVAFLSVAVAACGSPPPEEDVAELFLVPVEGDHSLPPGAENSPVARVEVAADEVARQRGLMHRAALPKDTGMLFIYPTEEVRGFWMKNTKIPLSIAYADSTGLIVSMSDMAPGVGVPDGRLPRYPSKGPATYALEMTLGWFAERGIRPGMRLVLHPALQAVRAR